jgi:hypothetical protein
MITMLGVMKIYRRGAPPRAPGVALGLPRMGLVLAVLCLIVLATGCQEPPKTSPQAATLAENWLNFEGDLSATGTRQVLDMGSRRAAKIFSFSGSLLLATHEGLSLGFQCEVMGYDNGAGTTAGSAVWTDDHGDRIFSEVTGESVAKGSHITGKITGGTGRYDGLTGEYDFLWQYVIQGPEGTIQGRAVGLKGRCHRVAQAQEKGSP